MEPQEIKDLVAAEVKAATEALQNQIEDLKATLDSVTKETEDLKASLASLSDDNKAVEETPVKKFVTPNDKIKVSKDLTVQFTAPTFIFQKKLYVSEAEVKSTELIGKLVAQQTVEGQFKDGLLKKVS